MKRDEYHQQAKPGEPCRSDYSIEQVHNENRFYRSRPEIVEVPEAIIEPVDVIRQQIDHLADGGLHQSSFAELQCFPVDQGTARNSDLHAKVLQREIIRVVGDHGEEGG